MTDSEPFLNTIAIANMPANAGSSSGIAAESGSGTEIDKSTKAIRDRYRIRFGKTGLLRWIGHHDLQRLWERLLRRCELRLSMSGGFHPKPRINFPSALALGVEGLDEVVEIELSQSLCVDELRLRLIQDGQPGLAIGEVICMGTADGTGVGAAMTPGVGKAKLHSSEYEIEIPAGFDLELIDRSLNRALSLDTISMERKAKSTVTLSIAEVFSSIERRGNLLHLTQLEIDGPSIKVADLLDIIGLSELVPSGATIRRTRVHLTDESSRSKATFQRHAHGT